jgi:hypothetical protein
MFTVAAMGVALVLACVVWAVVVQHVVPNVCTLTHPPAHAGYVKCPASRP